MDSVHRTPVELYGRADAVSARSQYDYRFLVFIVVHIISLYGIRHIEVVRQFRMFGSNGIDALHSRENTQLLAAGAYHKVLFLHIAFRAQHETRNLEVGEAEYLCFAQHVSRNVFHLIIL